MVAKRAAVSTPLRIGVSVMLTGRSPCLIGEPRWVAPQLPGQHGPYGRPLPPPVPAPRRAPAAGKRPGSGASYRAGHGHRVAAEPADSVGGIAMAMQVQSLASATSVASPAAPVLGVDAVVAVRG